MSFHTRNPGGGVLSDGVAPAACPAPPDTWEGPKNEPTPPPTLDRFDVSSPGRRPGSRRVGGSMAVSVFVHAAALAAAAQATLRLSHWELRLPQGRNSVALAASISSPRNESQAVIRIERAKLDEVQKAVERRRAETPAVAAVRFLSAEQDQRLPPPADTTRTESVERPEPPEVPERTPPKKTTEARLPPRDTMTSIESVASAPSAAESGVQSSAPPTEVVSVKPIYPPAALSAGLEGVVKLYVRLNEKGEVVEADVFQSSGHPELDQAALDVIYRWRFTAPDGKVGIAAEFIKPIPFRIVRGVARPTR